MSNMGRKPLVFAFGFDRLGLTMPDPPREEEGFVLRYIPYAATVSLEQADGLVIPSGIFEKVEAFHDWTGAQGLHIEADTHGLAAREKQYINATQRGAWAVFLLGVVHNGTRSEYRETDLAKKVLNGVVQYVTPCKPEPAVVCKADEFLTYLKRFGVAQTGFSAPRQKAATRVLAEVKSQVVGIETMGSLFFLPFFLTQRSVGEASEAAQSVVASVLEYKRKNDIYLPGWVNALQFKSEIRLHGEVKQTRDALACLMEEMQQWERFKAVLCTSGRNLNIIATEILREFFGLQLKSEEKFVEDALVYSPTGDVKYVVEIKGTNGGIKRENINQVDSHRERLGIPSTTPGLLIVNDFMDVEDFEARKAKAFDPGHLTHASNTNVKVLRAVTLIEWMFALEESKDRQTAFFEICDKAKPLVPGPPLTENAPS